MSNPERIFLGWDKPLAEAVAETLLGTRGIGELGNGAQGAGKQGESGAVDLGDQMVIVPLAFAGRLVEEALARQAGALMLPHIVTPQIFIGWGGKGDDSDVASREAMMMAWLEVLSAVDRQTMPSLFGAQASGRFTGLEERLRVAELLHTLRDRLGESPEGHDFAKTARLPGNEEPERWAALAELEDLYRDRLRDKGLRDRNDVRAERAVRDSSAGLEKALKTAGVTRLWLAFLTSPQPIALTALGNLAEKGVEIKSLVACDPSDLAGAGELFDKWGRPASEIWRDQRRREWPGFRSHVHVTSSEEDALEVLKSLVERQHRVGKELRTAGRLSVVPCDRERHPKMISRTLLQCQAIEQDPGTGKPVGTPCPVKTANPLGKPHRDHAIHHAMRAWLDLIESPSLRRLRTVLTISDCASNLLGGRGGLGALNRELDDIAKAMAPQRLSQATAFAQKAGKSLAAEAIQRAEEIVEGAGRSPSQLGRRVLALSCPKMGELPAQEAEMADEVIGAVEEALDHVGDIPGGGEVASTTLVRLALEGASEKAYRRNLDTDAVNLPGWQDAAWDPVPHLVIMGLNDNLIPEAHHSHPFLPQGLRHSLGLQSNEAIFAAAAHHLELLRSQRARLDVIVPRFGPDKEGLRPSRLLYLCPVGLEVLRGGDATGADRDFLIGKHGRLHHLFPISDEAGADAPWSIPEALRLDPAAWKERHAAVERLDKTLSPSALRTFLNSPGDFWLGNVLGMSQAEFEGLEMSPADFGTLVHDALLEFARDGGLRSSKDEAAILARVLESTERLFLERFGTEASSELQLQLKMARWRLASFARRQAEDAAAGWRILEVEHELVVRIPGTKTDLKLRFDRLDERIGPDGKPVEWRVLDYKTKSDEKGARDSHIVEARGDTSRHALAVFDLEDKAYRWTDLQLPLYHWAVCKSGKFPAIRPDKLAITYWILTPGGESKVEPWEDFSKEDGKGGFAGKVEGALSKVAAEIAKLASNGAEVELPFGRNRHSPLAIFGGRPSAGLMRTENMGTKR